MRFMRRDALATPAPERYSAWNPLRAARLAANALITPATCNGRSRRTAARSRAPVEVLRLGAVPLEAFFVTRGSFG